MKIAASLLPAVAMAVLVSITPTSANAQDAYPSAERFTAVTSTTATYETGVYTKDGAFVTNYTFTLKVTVPEATLSAISGKALVKQATWILNGSAYGSTYTVSTTVYTAYGATYLILGLTSGGGGGGSTTSTSKMVNISTRAIVAANGNLNPGFVISGTGKKTLLIRAVGPGLAAFGVTGTMADPVLTVYSGATVIATNDNWSANSTQATALRSAFTAAGAFGLTDGSKDAAVLLTLDPGSYTALVSGTGGGGGDTIVEVYEVP